MNKTPEYTYYTQKQDAQNVRNSCQTMLVSFAIFLEFQGKHEQLNGRSRVQRACCPSDLKATSPLKPALWINPSLMMWMSSSSCSERLMLPCLDVDTAVRHRFVRWCRQAKEVHTVQCASVVEKKRGRTQKKKKRKGKHKPEPCTKYSRAFL